MLSFILTHVEWESELTSCKSTSENYFAQAAALGLGVSVLSWDTSEHRQQTNVFFTNY